MWPPWGRPRRRCACARTGISPGGRNAEARPPRRPRGAERRRQRRFRGRAAPQRGPPGPPRAPARSRGGARRDGARRRGAPPPWAHGRRLRTRARGAFRQARPTLAGRPPAAGPSRGPRQARPRDAARAAASRSGPRDPLGSRGGSEATSSLLSRSSKTQVPGLDRC